MVELYLFESKKIWKKGVDFFKNLANLNPNENNYVAYVPKKKLLVGYFSDKNLTPSNEKFCSELSDKEELSNYTQKINQKKFIKEMQIEPHSLEALASSHKSIESAKNTFEVCFENLRKNTEEIKIKSQKS